MTQYYIYQITNLVNAKIYVGVHKTSNIDDGYMGSGKIINFAIKKYGINNFKKDILEFFDTSEAMYAREKEIVTPEFLLRDDTYNLRRGGFGGFDYINSQPWIATENRRLGDIKKSNTLKGCKNPTTTIRMLKLHASGLGPTPPSRKGILHSKETIDTMKLTRKGTGTVEKNSQYGTMWITNGTDNKKVNKNAVIDSNWYKGRTLTKNQAQ